MFLIFLLIILLFSEIFFIFLLMKLIVDCKVEFCVCLESLFMVVVILVICFIKESCVICDIILFVLSGFDGFWYCKFVKNSFMKLFLLRVLDMLDVIILFVF